MGPGLLIKPPSTGWIRAQLSIPGLSSEQDVRYKELDVCNIAKDTEMLRCL